MILGRHTAYLERQIELLREEKKQELAAQAEHYKAEIERLLALNHEQKMRLDRLELSVFANAGTAAGQAYVARTEPQDPNPPVEVESDQGTPWQRVQRRMIAKDQEQWNIREAAKKAAIQAGLIRPENDLVKH